MLNLSPMQIVFIKNMCSGLDSNKPTFKKDFEIFEMYSSNLWVMVAGRALLIFFLQLVGSADVKNSRKFQLLTAKNFHPLVSWRLFSLWNNIPFPVNLMELERFSGDKCVILVTNFIGADLTSISRPVIVRKTMPVVISGMHVFTQLAWMYEHTWRNDSDDLVPKNCLLFDDTGDKNDPNCLQRATSTSSSIFPG